MPPAEPTSPTPPSLSTSRHVGRTIWAVILSWLLPGIGQIYTRAYVRGFAVIAITFSYWVSAQLIFARLSPTRQTLIMIACLWAFERLVALAAAIDAGLRAWRPIPRQTVGWFKSTWFIAILHIAFNITLRTALPTAWHTDHIPSGSGVPTILIGDDVITKSLPSNTIPFRGSIITFHPPGDPATTFIKRVIGLPGDTVQITAGQLYINGAEISRTDLGPFTDTSSGVPIKGEEYLETLPGGTTDKIIKTTDQGFANNTPLFTVPEGDLFLLGDNRDNSEDSRFMDGPVGYVPITNIIGQADMIIWPPHRFQQLK
jgi:signal peptidase I